ncbi:MAG: SDR family NAD(P)-dependent oxidoreductase [Desulfovibrionaceae bacterium]
MTEPEASNAVRAALVTGAARGIGRAVCARLAAAGWGVVGLDLDMDPAAAPLPGVLARRGDVAAEADLAAAVAAVLERFGRLDAVVNNAAVQPSAALLDTRPEDWARVVDVNLAAPWRLVRAARAALAASRGAVVNVASVHALATSPGLGAYAVSKGGLAAMTRTLALELAAQGIRVNAVLPGAVETRLLRVGLERDPDPAAARAVLCARTPLGRVGRPEEIAEAVLFLADGERSGFITGQCLAVDGGALARLGTE